MKRLSLNENEIITIRCVLEDIRLKGWEKSGLGSMTFEDVCKLESKLDKWVNEKVNGWVLTEEGWQDPNPVYQDTADMFDPYYDFDPFEM